jgi:hypothetical protein
LIVINVSGDRLRVSLEKKKKRLRGGGYKGKNGASYLEIVERHVFRNKILKLE